MPNEDEAEFQSTGAEGDELVVESSEPNEGATYVADAAPAVESWKGPSQEEWRRVTESHASLSTELAAIRQYMQAGLTKPEAKAQVAQDKKAAPDEDDEFSDDERFKKAWERRVKDPRYERSILHRESRRALQTELDKVSAHEKALAEMRQEINTLHGHSMYANKKFAVDPTFAKYDKEFLKVINSGTVNDPEAAFEIAKARVDRELAAKAKAAAIPGAIPRARTRASLRPARLAVGRAFRQRRVVERFLELARTGRSLRLNPSRREPEGALNAAIVSR